MKKPEKNSLFAFLSQREDVFEKLLLFVKGAELVLEDKGIKDLEQFRSITIFEDDKSLRVILHKSGKPLSAKSLNGEVRQCLSRLNQERGER